MLEGDDVRGVAGEIAAFTQPAVLDFDQRDPLLPAAIGKHDDMLDSLVQTDPPMATAAQRAVGVEGDAVVRADRGDVSCGVSTALKSGARQSQPAASVPRSGAARAKRPATPSGELVARLAPAPPDCIRNAGQRQPASLSARQSARPGAAPGSVDGLGIGEAAKIRFAVLGDDSAGFLRHDVVAPVYAATAIATPSLSYAHRAGKAEPLRKLHQARQVPEERVRRWTDGA